MQKRRVYVHPSHFNGDCLRLRGSEAHYLLHVLRLREGDRVAIFDGRGRSRPAVVASAGSDFALLEVGAARVAEKPRLGFTLAQAVLKSRAMDMVVQKCTELGAEGIIGFYAERSVPRRAGPAADRKRRERAEKIAIGACRQCGRDFIPSIEFIPGIKALLRVFGEYDRVVVASPSGSSSKLHGLFSTGLSEEASRFLFIIGPEGDFSKEELDCLVSHGAIPCGLSGAVLRAETAAIALAAIAAHYLMSLEEKECRREGVST